MPKTRSRFLAVFFLPFVALVCLALFLALNVVFSIPQRAAKTFGEPSINLTTWQQITLGAQLLLQTEELIQPTNLLGKSVIFEIQPGETTEEIINRLWTSGLISEPGAFRAYLVFTGLDTRLRADKYTLSAAMTPLEIAHSLIDATPNTVTFVVLPGWRLEEIAASLPTSGLSITPDDFLTTSRSYPRRISFLSELPADIGLEGLLFPGAYDLPRSITLNELLVVLLRAFEQRVVFNLENAFANQGLSLLEAVTLASIVQREAVVTDEMPRIASVFLNRLSVGMKLDADPTVQYALGYNPIQNTWWTNPLSSSDLHLDSPYNTYLYPGLPPAPICNPGIEALNAVAYPEQTSYFYFRAACDKSGYHQFAHTYEEHLANACPDH
ncbi:MAG: endolytic transglycosylase MltG [Chloroflexota bacterium]